MSSPARIELHCEIDSLRPPIRGRFRDAAGHSREFCGWAELGSALVALAEDATTDPQSQEQR
ncbi:MAG: hypothetical protein AB7G37_11615 [Solirubrobacteraceae bacterium]